MRTRATSASVAVLGAGHVGAAITHTLVLQGIAERVILHDRQRARAEGEAWDIGDTTPLLHEGTVLPTDDYRDLADSDVVVVTVGANIKSGQSRLEVLGQNADLIRSVMGELDKVSREAVVVIATTPVDILTRIAIACSARPEHQILGSGTVVDTARLRYRLAATLGVDAEDTLVHVLGEHGDSQFAAWSSAAIGSIPLASFPVPSGMSLAQIQADCETTTRRRGADIHARKGYTSYGIAAAVYRISASILRDEGKIFTVSARALPDYGIGSEIALGLPRAIGRKGVARRLLLQLNAEEQGRLEKSAMVLATAYRSLS
jgi:L-lactate dehydrogenase